MAITATRASFGLGATQDDVERLALALERLVADGPRWTYRPDGHSGGWLPDPDPRGYLKAIDPMTGQAKWQTGFKSPNYSGTLVTAGGLVFTGELTGEFIAVDAESGKILWQFQTPSGIIGQPVTWERNGVQYVTVTSGIGGVYALRAGDPNLANVPAGASIWTFALFDK